MKKLLLIVIFLFGLSAVAVACGEVPSPQQAAPGSTADPSPQRAAPDPTIAPWPEEAQPLVDQAVADAVQRFPVTSSDVQVVEVEAVDWPNSCLGCAGKDEECLQVITPGYRLFVQVGAQTYEYHAGDDRIILCQEGQPAEDWGEAQPLIDMALTELTERAHVGTDDIEVISVEAVDWPDACLGCPGEGEACATVITPGYRLLLSAGGQTYEYRTDMERVVLCQEGSKMGDWGEAQPLVDLVVADLAEQLKVESEEVTVVQVEEKSWRDSSLGCPQPGQMYLQVITPGYQIVLEVQGQQYDYHTDAESAFILCEQ